MQHESEGETNCNQCAWYSHQRIGKGTAGIGNKRTSGDNPNYSIIKSDQISFNSFKNEITFKLFTFKSSMNIHLNVCKQMTDVN